MEARLQSIDSNRVKYTESQDSIRLSAAAVQPAQQMICKRVTVVVAQPFAKATCQNAGELPTDLFAMLAVPGSQIIIVAAGFVGSGFQSGGNLKTTLIHGAQHKDGWRSRSFHRRADAEMVRWHNAQAAAGRSMFIESFL